MRRSYGAPTDHEMRQSDLYYERAKKTDNPHLQAHLDKLLNRYGNPGGYIEFAKYWSRREDGWKSQGIIGFTFERFAGAFWNQGGRCRNPSCVSPPFLGIDDPMVMPDHCHYTRKFRGILCGECNTMEGRLRIERRLKNMSQEERDWFEKWSDQHLDTQPVECVVWDFDP